MGDWASQAVDAIDKTVQTVRSKTVEPAENVSTTVVHGLIASSFVVFAAILITICIFRLLTVYVPGDVWIVYMILAGIFTAAGMFVWSKRRA
ncbi:MAG: hypothetical protein KAZ88_00235 [Acidimicrobiia bacterium]|jgi:hypothetical protein|nr:hypothetical protein [Acidimicrobiia bacterium]MBP8179404.1 hypothetical protein [Acidimicrobiia bacterium]